MKLRDFVNLYDNWNGILVVNDDNLNPIVKNEVEVALSYGDTRYVRQEYGEAKVKKFTFPKRTHALYVILENKEEAK